MKRLRQVTEQVLVYSDNSSLYKANLLRVFLFLGSFLNFQLGKSLVFVDLEGFFMRTFRTKL